MNEIAFSPRFLTGEFGLLALILIFILVEVFKKKPVFASTNRADFERRNRQAGWLAAIGMASLIVIVYVLSLNTVGEEAILLNNSLKGGGGVYLGKFALMLAGFFAVLLSYRYLSSQDIPGADYYVLLLFSLLGGITLICAENFVVVFLGLEMMSIPIYGLVALKRYGSRAGESAIKYVLLGGFSSAFLLLGISFLYGATGSLVISEVMASISKAVSASQNVTFNTQNLLIGLGLTLVFVGLAFKVSMVPFHAWTPDVYEGASTPITAYMSVFVKLAAFAVILKVFSGAAKLGFFDSILSRMIAFFALITVIYGNTVAIVQKNVKRMLAYSSIAHAGYMALAVAPMSHSLDAIQAVLFYGIGYIFMNLLAFGVLVYLTHKEVYCETLDDLKGLARRHPLAAASMAIAMFSLAGIPPAVGFVGKLQIFMELIHGGMIVTAVIALLASLVALYFYLNVIIVMYLKTPDPEEQKIKFEKTGSLPAAVSLGITAALVLILGILPSYLINMSLSWAITLF
ncbi:NADH-quinone oxidoreductase subunit N [candidate division KSB1 bacterium]|nr:NADH-quinone oxidoreductase subunit N [candidate division KSB1 bacterium]